MVKGYEKTSADEVREHWILHKATHKPLVQLTRCRNRPRISSGLTRPELSARLTVSSRDEITMNGNNFMKAGVNTNKQLLPRGSTETRRSRLYPDFRTIKVCAAPTLDLGYPWHGRSSAALYSRTHRSPLLRTRPGYSKAFLAAASKTF